MPTATIEACKKLLTTTHREVFDVINTTSVITRLDDTIASGSNFDRVPFDEDDKVICGSLLDLAMPDATPSSTRNRQADMVLAERLQFPVDWADATVHQSADVEKTKDVFTSLLLIRCKGVICWNAQTVREHVDILRLCRGTGRTRFSSVAALSRVWLGRAPSNALQKRVASTGGIVISYVRASTNNLWAEKQMLLRHNRKEINPMEADSGP
ncbi:hypothetical protein F441_20630 [Phytophthora nicotianae CJ01A1]|uniref:Uncharacterized protein n=3 Tax=Phytophthora nicotianae TaxID=4792 RepID=V9DV36_PHYNI|nr:hypothetical protein F443_22681 [Phytophthora nicotianae P1569]ETK75685.1 hypothetical protein L915_17747 [Phytophthora nicotianae]ETP02285.1 hypothetical protein F441_20630 [Phytophthora nicotianae CJ01A1]ETL29117.1 hypothetical protein L916_17647 [Phytophthora nicotianae]ETL82342.1 hypothetical protein L917_17487 [Phytophthora nicotianae]